jgi:hypothetical protein
VKRAEQPRPSEIVIRGVRENNKPLSSDQPFSTTILQGRLLEVLKKKTGVAWELAICGETSVIRLCPNNVFGFAADNIQAVFGMGQYLPKGVVANGYTISADIYGPQLTAKKELRYGVQIRDFERLGLEDLKHFEQSNNMKDLFKDAKYNVDNAKSKQQTCIIF